MKPAHILPTQVSAEGPSSCRQNFIFLLLQGFKLEFSCMS